MFTKFFVGFPKNYALFVPIPLDDETRGSSRISSSAGTANPVDVVFARRRDVEIDHMVDIHHIQTTAG